jgi:16S rRNA (guanine(966)-N(2))-methyltransferase RsmD
MRIISGRLGGRRLKVPPGVIRPAMDQMRESVFATLDDISGASFLDLFAGSGSIGIEAASRGAAHIVFVESDRKKIAVLRQNVAIIGGADPANAPATPADGPHTSADGPTAQVVSRPVERYLASPPEGAAFDYVFADPPFPYRHRAKVLELLGASPLLGPGALILMHYPVESPLPAEIPGLERIREKKFGRSMVGYFRRVAVS